jgi:enoyl-CoA hydratase/carnithine racemase
MGNYETLLYEERNGVAWVTLNRPEVNNAFNPQMQSELKDVWIALRRNDDVRCVVLTGAGEKAFCTGIDREIMDNWGGTPSNPWSFAEDIGRNIGPKTNHLWKPVISAINGMACGGAFYFMGESEFIISSEKATFFDPHVTYGMVAGFESVHLMQKAPFHEVMRIALLGNYERLSAQRAYEIGLVSEVVPQDKLVEAATWAAETIAAQPAAAIQGTVRTMWMGLDASRTAAIELAPLLVRLGTTNDNINEGQAGFRGKTDRPKPRIR